MWRPKGLCTSSAPLPIDGQADCMRLEPYTENPLIIAGLDVLGDANWPSLNAQLLEVHAAILLA